MATGTLNITIQGGTGLPNISIKGDTDNIERYIENSYVNGEVSFNSICDGQYHTYTITISQDGFLSDTAEFTCKCDPDVVPPTPTPTPTPPAENDCVSMTLESVDRGYTMVTITVKNNVPEETYFYVNTEDGNRIITMAAGTKTATDEVPSLYTTPTYVNNSAGIPKCLPPCVSYIVGANNGRWDVAYLDCEQALPAYIFSVTGETYTFCALLDSIDLQNPEATDAFIGVVAQTCIQVPCADFKITSEAAVQRTYTYIDCNNVVRSVIIPAFGSLCVRGNKDSVTGDAFNVSTTC